MGVYEENIVPVKISRLAEYWAKIKRDRAKANKAIVSVYEIDDSVVFDSNLLKIP